MTTTRILCAAMTALALSIVISAPAHARKSQTANLGLNINGPTFFTPATHHVARIARQRGQRHHYVFRHRNSRHRFGGRIVLAHLGGDYRSVSRPESFGGAGNVSLNAKEQELISACGAHRTTHGGYRRAAGYHGLDQARDMVGPWACIYSHLRGWPGGVSTDPGRVHHVHFDIGRGMVCHFAHGQRGCNHPLPY